MKVDGRGELKGRYYKWYQNTPKKDYIRKRIESFVQEQATMRKKRKQDKAAADQTSCLSCWIVSTLCSFVIPFQMTIGNSMKATHPIIE